MPNRDTNETRRVLFLCTGNYYRSRFAEILFNAQAAERGLSWTADSRGLALDGCNSGPISKYTLACLQSRGIESGSCERFPKPLTEADLATADHIVAVKEAEHRPLFEAKFPQWRDRIEYWAIHDLDCAEPDVAIPHLEREVVRLLERLAA
jgi:protein-tyrosine phosphatase